MAALWRESIQALQQQFNTAASQSKGLFHVLVETDGPDAKFRTPSFIAMPPKASSIDPRWNVVGMGNPPMFSPSFREYKPEDVALEGTKWLDQDVIIRDKKGNPRAVMSKGGKRFGFYCGDIDAYSYYRQLATAVGKVLLGLPRQTLERLPRELQETMLVPGPYRVHKFGNVKTSKIMSAGGWMASIMVEDDGVVICEPIPVHRDNQENWTLLLYLIAWMSLDGFPLSAEKWYWQDNTSVAVPPTNLRIGGGLMAEVYKSIPKDAFYSTLGDKENPTDLFLASAWCIAALIHLIEQENTVSGEQETAF